MPSTSSAKRLTARPRTWRAMIGLFLTLVATITAVHAQSRANVAAVSNDSCGTGTVPLEFREGLALAKLSVNHQPMTFIIDSAGMTMINSDRVTLPVVAQIHTGIVTASTTEPLQTWNIVNVKSLAIGSAEVRDSHVLSRSMRSLETKLGKELDGILGIDVLRLWDSVSLSYKRKALVLDGARCTHTRTSDSLPFRDLHTNALGMAWR
jgi:hypothetical protein